MTVQPLPHALSRHDHEAIGPSFHRWQSLTDTYATLLDALRRQEPGASAALTQISRDLAQFQKDVKHAG
jgi:hypothetical protein